MTIGLILPEILIMLLIHESIPENSLCFQVKLQEMNIRIIYVMQYSISFPIIFPFRELLSFSVKTGIIKIFAQRLLMIRFITSGF